jgi:hypothetical protein
MFFIFSIIKQFIFFAIIFISFHFTFNYFRNLFLSKRTIFTHNEKYDEIHQILQPMPSQPPPSPSPTPTNAPPSLTETDEIQPLEKPIDDPPTDAPLLPPHPPAVTEPPEISSIDY